MRSRGVAIILALAHGGLFFQGEVLGLAGSAGVCPCARDVRAVLRLVERFGRRGTEPFELFRSEFGQNSWNPGRILGIRTEFLESAENHENQNSEKASNYLLYKEGP